MLSDDATRAHAFEQMRSFAPRMGRCYASGRNYDRGPGLHRDVSGLSPFLRRRLITEQEVVATALAEHGLDGAEAFIQEVVWRGYFKGWLERRPDIWTSYRSGLERDRIALDKDRALRRQLQLAETGSTGLECFDAWSQELVETGYLHNHARMWFASIWIFTFGLPWRLGADFFYRYLLDGDPASNTLSWRWVAGLHTRGKVYEAQAWNIAKFTDGRFAPRESDLTTGLVGLDVTEEPEGLPDVTPLREVIPPKLGIPTALVITEEDCCIADFNPHALDIRAVVKLSASHLRSTEPVAPMVSEVEACALADTIARCDFDLQVEDMRAGIPSDLAKWASRAGARQIATGYVPQGPLRDWLDEATPALQANGIDLCEWQRDWDRLLWPHATAGFFKVKKRIPHLLHDLGML